jgi:hypothetical protein
VMVPTDKSDPSDGRNSAKQSTPGKQVWIQTIKSHERPPFHRTFAWRVGGGGGSGRTGMLRGFVIGRSTDSVDAKEAGSFAVPWEERDLEQADFPEMVFGQSRLETGRRRGWMVSNAEAKMNVMVGARKKRGLLKS